MARGVYAYIHEFEEQDRGRRAGSRSLRELRQLLGMTQQKVAEGALMSQGDLSCLERRRDWLCSSLRRYAEGLGGRLEVVVVIDGERFLLDV